MKRIVLILISLLLLIAYSAVGTAQTQSDSNKPEIQPDTEYRAESEIGIPIAPPQEVSPPPTSEPAAPVQPAAPAAVGPPAEYVLKPDDVVRMQVFGEPDLTVEQAVNPSGYVTIPLVGQVFAQDLTQAQLVEVIQKGLSKYLVEPKVQLTLSQVREPKVFVLGQVNRPGPIGFKPGQRIMEAVAGAGSFTDVAYLEAATLTHKGSQESTPVDLRKLFLDGDMSQNLPLKDGDTIFIPEDTKNKYFVLGEVMRPMMYRLKTNVTVIDAITTAGGPTPRGSLKNTYIIRGDPKSPQRIKVNIGKLVKSADLTQNVVLQPGDVVYVAESSKPDWTKIGNVLSVIVNSSYLFRFWGM